MASMHCDAFYPQVAQSGVLGPLLKLDRVVAMELGTDRRLGKCECLVAHFDDSGNIPPGLQGRFTTGNLLLDFAFHLAFPPQVLEQYVINYQQAGIVGAVVVDTLMEHVPNGRNGRKRLKTAYLSNLAVSPSSRRMGVGKALLKRAEQTAAGSWGCTFMTLHVDSSNSGAIQLYRSAGYRFVARQPEWQRILEGRSSGLVLMVKRLEQVNL